MDSGSFLVGVSEDTDVAQIVEYNAGDADLRARLAEKISMNERIYILTISLRDTISGGIANDTEILLFFLQQSGALRWGWCWI
jgi:hypothetical protein